MDRQKGDFGGEDVIIDEDIDNEEVELGPIDENEVEIVDEESQDDAPREEMVAEEQDVSEKPKRDPLKSKLNRITRDRERAYYENNLLKQELEKYKAIASQSAEIAFKNHEIVVNQNLDAAKKAKFEAEELGDVHAKIEADTIFNSAMYDAQKLNDTKAQYQAEQEYRLQQAPQQEQQAGYAEDAVYSSNPEPYLDWVEDNKSWMDANSPAHDPWLAGQIDAYTSDLSSRMIQSGIHPDQVDPDAYLADVNNKIAELNNWRAQQDAYNQQAYNAPRQQQPRYQQPERQQYQQPQNQQRRDLNMKPSRQPVSPVRGQRGGYAGQQSQSSDRPRMSKEDYEHFQFTKRAEPNITIQEYAKHIAEQRARNVDRHR